MSEGNSGVLEFYPEAEQGWQCPECKTIYSPSVMSCAVCAGAEVPKETVQTFPYSPGTEELMKRVEDVDDGPRR